MSQQGRTVFCKICGKPFYVLHGYRYRYCSDACRLKGKAIIHRGYVSKNKKHLNEYAKQRREGIWGTSNREIGKSAELHALNKLLPLLGFTEIYHVSPIRRFVPFDFVATLRGVRVLIDVTTTISKGGSWNRTALLLARALGMPLIIVFIKPDLSGYMMRDAFDGGTVLVNQVKPLPK